jgi:ABC-2 type transport system ATP-binding protein
MSTPNEREAAVDVAGLRKQFGDRVALADFSLRLNRGKIFGAVGANGGGKTTALRLLAGLLPADGGQGRVLGLDLRARPSQLRMRVGYMTQHYSLYRDFTVSENLMARARIYGVPNPRARVTQLLARFRLDRFAQERVGRLSSGWMRRTQFAATLVPEPSLLLLDEPTAGLDLETSRQLWDCIVELAARGTTVIVSTHDLVEAGRCDEIGVFVEGEVVARGAVEKVIERSAACVVRVNVSRDGDAALRADLPGLAFIRRGARHHDLVFRGEPPVSTVTWLTSQNLSIQAVESTLADAMSIFVNTQSEAHNAVA